MEQTEQKPMTEFELCRELNKHGFPQIRRDDSWYFIRPDLLVQMNNIDALYGIDKRPPHNFFETAIYYPTIEDFENFLQNDLQSVVQTVRSGWFAYANSTAVPGATVRSGAPTMWLALANVVYAKYLENHKDFKPIIESSENVANAVETNETQNGDKTE